MQFKFRPFFFAAFVFRFPAGCIFKRCAYFRTCVIACSRVITIGAASRAPRRRAVPVITRQIFSVVAKASAYGAFALGITCGKLFAFLRFPFFPCLFLGDRLRRFGVPFLLLFRQARELIRSGKRQCAVLDAFHQFRD